MSCCWNDRTVLGEVKIAVGGTAEDIYTVPANTKAELDTLVVTNASGSAGTYDLYIDTGGGSTYNSTTVVHLDVPIAANTTVFISMKAWPVAATTDVGVEADVTTTIFRLLGRTKAT